MASTQNNSENNRVRRSKRLSSGGDSIATQRHALADISTTHNAARPPTHGKKVRKTSEYDAVSGVRNQPVPAQVAHAKSKLEKSVKRTHELDKQERADDNPFSRKHEVCMDEGSDLDELDSSSSLSPIHPPAWLMNLSNPVRASLLQEMSSIVLLHMNIERDFMIQDCCAKFSLSESAFEELANWYSLRRNSVSARSASDLTSQLMWSGETSQAYLYADEIYENLLHSEAKYQPTPDYMDHQSDITHNMRSILVDWLVEVGEEYKLSSQTLFLTVNYIDRLLGQMPINRNKLQLLGITCMLVGSKYEEIYPPSIDEFVYISDNTYSRKEVLNMESVLLTSLAFNLAAPTPWEFTRRYCSAGNIDSRVKNLAFFLTELTMLHPSYLKHRPSIMAASSISLALYTVHHPPWSPCLYRASGYTEENLRDCMKDIHDCHCRNGGVLGAEADPHQPLKAVREKYKEAKYQDVASIPVRPIEPGASNNF